MLESGQDKKVALVKELALIFVLILANGLFACAEIAIVTVRKSRLKELAERSPGAAAAVLWLKKQPERFLATVQVGITVVSTAAAAFGGASLARHLEPLVSTVPRLAPHADGVALGIVIAGVSYLSIVLGELVPKSLGLRSAERFSLVLGKPLVALAWFARPLVALLTWSSNLVLRPFGDRTNFAETRHTKDELQQLVEEAASAGTVHPRVAQIASKALDFAELTAASVMVPRQDVVMLRRHAPPEEVRQTLLEHTHSRMPVYEGQVDNVVGYVSVKDLLAFAWEQRLIVLEDVMRPPYFVPRTQRAMDVLQEMKTRHIPFAIVVDEQGGTSGIITIEDLVEELVGDIFNEYAHSSPDPIQKQEDGSVTVAGAVPVRDVNSDLPPAFELPEDVSRWTTVAGLCIAVAGHIPTAGERLRVDNGAELEILDASPRRVRRVRIIPSKPRPRR